ncbi:hypothetical protein [Dokdonella sp.]|uniref:hypothetical protein n=1 Tax=Dokdonella sp. TaxID=2291710 RepID=UPI0031C63ACE|nr:hypothetical protein [Dokdonella sp.]
MSHAAIPRAFALALCFALAMPAVVQAAAQSGWKFAVDTPAEFEVQAAEVRKEMSTDGRYGAISVDDRNAVEADLKRIDDLLESKGSVKALNDQEQVDLMNAQERINAVLTKNDGNRLICTMEQRTGTNFKKKVCQTARQRDQIREDSQKAHLDSFRLHQPVPPESARGF